MFLRTAKEKGGTMLDHFDGFLSGLYRRYGFTDVYEVYQWEEQYRPDAGLMTLLTSSMRIPAFTLMP